MERITGLPPVIDANCRVLVLGTMPGAVSLQRQQYYAHERNRFWDIIEALVGVPRSAPYETRLESLKQSGIGLWDVLQHCDRKGSLDEQIRNGVPNDFTTLLQHYPQVQAIALNGRKAASLFHRLVQFQPRLPHHGLSSVTLWALPSTSPANAKGGLAALLERWRVVQDCLSRARTVVADE
jgi:hypoxanthine-DNA glycosylase